MNKRAIGIIAAVIIVVGGFIWLTQPKPESKSTAAASNHVIGNGSKKVTLIEYGDYQCSACAAYMPIVTSVVEKYKDEIFFQYRNFPLEAIHQNARAASRAAEAAALQGKFWEMNASLFQNQKSWESTGDPLTLFTSYAKQIGITDTVKFTTDYKSTKVNDIINADLREGQKFNISGTPTFILNGKKITENPRDQASFEKLIVNAIAAQATKQ